MQEILDYIDGAIMDIEYEIKLRNVRGLSSKTHSAGFEEGNLAAFKTVRSVIKAQMVQEDKIMTEPKKLTNRQLIRALRFAADMIENQGSTDEKTNGRYLEIGNIAIKIGAVENITPEGWE